MTPPEILEVTIEPSQIDVGSGSAVVVFTIKVFDDMSGVSAGELDFDSVPGISGGSVFRLAPTTDDSNHDEHVWRIRYPQYYSPQTRFFLNAWIRDKAGNQRTYSRKLLDNLGLSASLEILPWEKEDRTPPELVEVNVRDPVVDASDDSAPVLVDFRATDDDSGVATVQLEFDSPSGQHETQLFARAEGFNPSPFGGDHLGVVEVAQYSEAGTWRLARAYLSDKSQNQRLYDAEELSALGLAVSFEVVSDPQDLEPPVPVELTLDSTEVNVTDGPATIGVTVRVTDDLSGVDRVEVDFEGPSKDWELTVGHVLSGWESSTDGIYVGTLTVPQSSEAGTWNLKSIAMTDHVGNWGWYHPSARSSVGIFAYFQVVEDLN